MHSFFSVQPDYLLLILGVLLALLVAPAIALARREPERPWRFLAGFGALQALHAWLTLIALAGYDHAGFASVRQGVFAGSFLILAAFADRAHSPELASWSRRSRWALLVPVMALAWWLGAGCAWALIMGLGGWSAHVLWAWHRAEPAGRGLPIAAGALPVYGALISLPVVVAPAAPPSLWLLGGSIVAAALLAGSLAAYRQHPRATAPRSHPGRGWACPAHLCLLGVVLALAVGGVAAQLVERQRDRTMRQDILQRAQLAAATLDPTLVPQLAWNASDLAQPAYRSLKQTMQAIVQANRDVRFAMIMGVRAGQAAFLVDSEAPDSADYSPPGESYTDARPDYLAGLARRQPFVIGPFTDRWGCWITSSIPLPAQAEGDGYTTFDLDISATTWAHQLARARLPVLLLTMLFVGLLLTFAYAHERSLDHLDLLARSQQVFALLVEHSPDAVQMLDADGCYLTINRPGLAALGYREEAQVRGRSFAEVWPTAPGSTELPQALARARQGTATTLELEPVPTDPQRHCWKILLQPVHDHRRRVASLTAICSDITARKQAENEARAAQAAAATATAAKNEFFAAMSHELRTPLSSVISLLELIRHENLSSEGRQRTTLAQDRTRQLLTLIDDILDLAQLEAGKISLALSPFDPRAELSGLVEALGSRAEEKKLTLHWQVDPDVPPRLLGDHTRLRQIIINLLSNAFKFTERGGITVRLAATPRNPDSVYLRLQVSDTGIGIAPDMQARLFAKFEQADLSSHRRSGGAGLGLSFVYLLAKLMDGSVTLESTPGGGSTFTVQLPMAHCAPPPEPSTAALPPSNRVLHLLCAEDDATHRLIAKTLLQNYLGHQVVFAEDGQQAVDQLAAHTFDAVLMDNRMPGMDGFEAARRIRDPASPVLDHQVYIIACTANISDDYRAQCSAAGMQDFLTKPIQEADLRRVLARACAYQARRDAAPATPVPAPPSVRPPAPEPTPETAPAEVPPGLSEADLLAIIEQDAATPPPPAPLVQFSAAAAHAIAVQFRHDAPGRIQEMQTALARADQTTLGRSAHTLKSSAHYVSAQLLADLCKQIEKLADAGRLDEAAPLVAQAASALDHFLQTPI